MAFLSICIKGTPLSSYGVVLHYVTGRWAQSWDGSLHWRKISMLFLRKLAFSSQPKNCQLRPVATAASPSSSSSPSTLLLFLTLLFFCCVIMIVAVVFRHRHRQSSFCPSVSRKQPPPNTEHKTETPNQDRPFFTSSTKRKNKHFWLDSTAVLRIYYY